MEVCLLEEDFVGLIYSPFVLFHHFLCSFPSLVEGQGLASALSFVRKGASLVLQKKTVQFPSVSLLTDLSCHFLHVLDLSFIER